MIKLRNTWFVSLCLIVLLVLPLLFYPNGFVSTSINTQLANETFHDGDMTVEDNETFVIENCTYHLYGNLTIKNNATLIIRDALFNQTGPNRVWIYVQDQAKFIVSNSTLFISQVNITRISVENNAFINITNTILVHEHESFYIWPIDNAEVYVTNCEIRGAYQGGRVICDGNSTVHINKLLFNTMVLWASSACWIEDSNFTTSLRVFNSGSVFAKNCVIEFISAEGNSSSNIRDSQVNSYISIIGQSKIWLIHCSVDSLDAAGNSTAWLISSSVGAFSEGENSSILVGWELPLIGIIAFHYTLMPTIQIVVMTILGVILAVIAFVAITLWEKKHVKDKGKNTEKDKSAPAE